MQDISRRNLLQVAAGSGVLAPLPSIGAPVVSLAVTGLRTDNLENPMGVHTPRSRLSWRLVSGARNVVQAGYRIEVASSRADLVAGKADLWDTGRVASDRAFDIAYLGSPLTSRQRAWWRVTVWDNRGERATSDAAFWEMGLLQPQDWKGDWIVAESDLQRGDRETGLVWVRAPGDMKAIRLSFLLEADAEVVLTLAANAQASPFIDGAPLAPYAPKERPPVSVSHTIPLRAGPHALCLELGEQLGNLAGAKDGAECALLVRAQYPSGRVVRFGGTQARAAVRPPNGWRGVPFDDAGWAVVSRADTPGMPFASNGGALLRRDFDVAGGVTSARLYVTALGAHETHINGRQVGDALLAPEWTDFADRILYRVHDVTDMLREGSNAIGAIVGDGWYGSRVQGGSRFTFGDPPLRYLAQLEIRYADGHMDRLVTDEDWSVGASPITFCEIYDGEDYDARREQAGWSTAEFRAKNGWTRARAGERAKGALVGHVAPPIRRLARLQPRSLALAGETRIVDFGQNFAGFVEIRLKGKAGEHVTLRFSEILDANGGIDQSNLRSARASDTYTLRGDPAGEVYAPRFTYHGFRYVEISGTAPLPSIADITGIVIHTDLPETGELRIGNTLIMRGWQNNLWSQRSNFVGLPTDCPQRDERMGWLGDANVFWDAAAFNMDVAAFTRRWMGDLRDSQTREGVILDTSPATWGLDGKNGSSPGWSDAGVMLPWTVWKRYGDTSVIDENWDMMTRYLRFIAASNPGHLWTVRRGSDFADWLAFDAKEPGDPTTPKDLVGTAMWKRSVDAMIEMARASGRDAEVQRHAATSRAIKAAFIEAYLHKDGIVGNDSQTSYILALAFDLVPADARALVAARLHANIERRGTVLTTGFLGTPFSLDVLADAGYAATVYDLLLRTAYPSWGYMAAKGATTTWERWNGDTGDVSMNSFNHYALGAINGFVYRRIAGIAPLEPGFRSFRVDPVLDPRLTSGGATYHAVVGRIATHWTRRPGGSLTVELSVPANAKAMVVLPTPARERVREGGKALRDATVSIERGQVVVHVGSGDYRFDVA